MNERTIFNYQLVKRIRSTPLWQSFYIIVLFMGLIINFITYPNLSWTYLFLFISILYIVYFFWIFWYFIIKNRKTKVFFPYLPWFGIVPKNILSFQDYKRFESFFLLLVGVSFLWMLTFIPASYHFFSFFFYISLFMFRLFLLIRIISFKQPNLWIRYETYGISVYKSEISGNPLETNKKRE